jgi:hypothetical protein
MNFEGYKLYIKVLKEKSVQYITGSILQKKFLIFNFQNHQNSLFFN